MKAIRKLRSNEIECRVGTCKEKGFSLLLYKDARADMIILDESFGCDGWQREHREIKGHLFCCVSIWNGTRWIVKEDVGTESNAEATKGEASDSFKRACVNVGIGRELYTAPFIWINAKEKEVYQKGQGYSTYAKFRVKSIGYSENGDISNLIIIDEKDQERFWLSEKSKPMSDTPTVTIGQDPFKEPSLKDQTKELSQIEKFKHNIIEMGKNPVLKEFEKTEYRGKFKTATTLEALKNLSAEMELTIRSKEGK